MSWVPPERHATGQPPSRADSKYQLKVSWCVLTSSYSKLYWPHWSTGSDGTRSGVWWADDLMWSLKGLKFGVKSQSTDSAKWTDKRANLWENTPKYLQINSWIIIREGHELGFTLSFNVWSSAATNSTDKMFKVDVYFHDFCFLFYRCQLICKSLTHIQSNVSQCRL